MQNPNMIYSHFSYCRFFTIIFSIISKPSEFIILDWPVSQVFPSQDPTIGRIFKKILGRRMGLKKLGGEVVSIIFLIELENTTNSHSFRLQRTEAYARSLKKFLPLKKHHK